MDRWGPFSESNTCVVARLPIAPRSGSRKILRLQLIRVFIVIDVCITVLHVGSQSHAPLADSVMLRGERGHLTEDELVRIHGEIQVNGKRKCPLKR